MQVWPLIITGRSVTETSETGLRARLVCRIAKERDRELERDLDGGALGMKAAPILRHSGHHPLRQRGGTRTAVMLAPFARITGGNVLTHGSVGSGGETRHKLYNELGAGKLDSVYLQSIPTDEAKRAGYFLRRLDAALATLE